MYNYSKENRLLTKGDFLYLSNNSKKIVLKSLIIYYKSSLKEDVKSRLGISVSRKFGKANKRNLFKRIVRETFRKSDFKNAGFDLLIVANNKLFKKDEKLSKENKELITSNISLAFKKIMEK